VLPPTPQDPTRPESLSKKNRPHGRRTFDTHVQPRTVPSYPAQSHAGGELNLGRLCPFNALVTDNSTAGQNANGGALFVGNGNALLEDTTVSGNSTSGQNACGGGLGVENGDGTLVRSTLSGNSTAGQNADGGAMAVLNGTATLTNSTLSANSTTTTMNDADAGTDAGTDAGVDAGIDAGTDPGDGGGSGCAVSPFAPEDTSWVWIVFAAATLRIVRRTRRSVCCPGR